MSRHGYTDDGDDDNLAMGRWIGRVRSAIRGKRGQAFLREMIAALDAMPEKKLARSVLVGAEGEVCAMGCVLKARGTDVTNVDPEEYETVAEVTGLAEAMVREIAYENDEGSWRETDEQRWTRMRKWAEKEIKDGAA
jgi:hypothetical protein